MKEQQIQKQIIDWLRLSGWFVIKNNTTGTYVRKTDKYIPNQARGLADLTIIKDGVVVMVEVKTPTGRQSDTQKEFQNNWEEHGGKYILVHSLEELWTHIQ